MPRLMASFITSYELATLEKTPRTRETLSSSGTVRWPKCVVLPLGEEPGEEEGGGGGGVEVLLLLLLLELNRSEESALLDLAIDDVRHTAFRASDMLAGSLDE